ncbi:NAD(+) diphosphatase [Aurantivibrio infirmus]
MNRFFSPHFTPRAKIENSFYVLMTDDELLVNNETSNWQPLPKTTLRFLDIDPIEQHHIGSYHGESCYALKINKTEALPETFHWEGLRGLLARGAIGKDEFDMVSCAMQVFNWDKSHQFCGQCGQATTAHDSERARMCVHCKIHYYPRISPCVIMLITKGEECLLAQHTQSRSQFYSALAGFIEPGESVENALRREVAEEVALSVGDLSYFGSQPWPFPGQLMLGFHAEYDSGDIKIQEEEIVDARWFHYGDLPQVPPASTLSGMLIQGFVEQCKAQN